MNRISEKLLKMISDFAGEFRGAFNIRENGECVGRCEERLLQTGSITQQLRFVGFFPREMLVRHALRQPQRQAEREAGDDGRGRA